MALARGALLAGLVFVLSGCEPDQSAPALQYASLAGRVYDTASGQPITGAVVSVNTTFQHSAPTGSDGLYSVANLPPGAVTVYASAPNYRDSSPLDESLVANTRNSLDIGLTHN